jgi:hypothetical protein
VDGLLAETELGERELLERLKTINSRKLLAGDLAKRKRHISGRFQQISAPAPTYSRAIDGWLKDADIIRG